MSSYNPLGSKHTIVKKGFLNSVELPAAQPGFAPVFSDGLDFYYFPEELTKSQIKKRSYQTLYFVDISPHKIETTVCCPCKNAIYRYRAELKLECSVCNPQKILKNNVNDMKTYLETMIEEWAGKTIGLYDEFQFEEVRKALSNSLDSLKFELEEAGVRILHQSLVLQPDESIKERLAKHDTNEHDHMDQMLRERYKQAINTEKVENAAKLWENLVDRFGNEQDSLLWMDKILGGNDGQSIITQGIENQNARMNMMMSLLKKLSETEGIDQADMSNVLHQLLNNFNGDTKKLSESVKAPAGQSTPEELFADGDDEDE